MEASYDVLSNVYEWNRDGITSFVKREHQLHREEDNSVINMGPLTNEVIYNGVKNKLNDTQLKDAMNCLIFGVNGEGEYATSYNSVLEIDGVTFTQCMEVLNDAVDELTTGSRMPKQDWLDKCFPEKKQGEAEGNSYE